VSVHPCQ